MGSKDFLDEVTFSSSVVDKTMGLQYINVRLSLMSMSHY